MCLEREIIWKWKWILAWKWPQQPWECALGISKVFHLLPWIEQILGIAQYFPSAFGPALFISVRSSFKHPQFVLLKQWLSLWRLLRQ